MHYQFRKIMNLNCLLDYDTTTLSVRKYKFIFLLDQLKILNLILFYFVFSSSLIHYHVVIFYEAFGRFRLKINERDGVIVSTKL